MHSYQYLENQLIDSCNRWLLLSPIIQTSLKSQHENISTINMIAKLNGLIVEWTALRTIALKFKVNL